MLSILLQFLLCVFVSVTGVLRNYENTPAPSNVLLEKYWWKNATMSEKTMEATTPTYKFPTATWSAAAYEERKKMFRPETSKLYLFKPSPFLKPPFTEGDVGASISGIEDGVDVMGRRSGKPKRISSDRRIGVGSRGERRGQEAVEDSSQDPSKLDHFLERSLGKYLKSSNLDEIFGHITVESFSEALKRVLEEKRSKIPPYDRNKELRRKFRDEILFPRKSKNDAGLREKQYQKRLQKTWGVINEYSKQQKQMTSEDNMSEFASAEDTSEAVPSKFDDFYAKNPSFTEKPASTASWVDLEVDEEFDGFDDTFSPEANTTHPSSTMPEELWRGETNNREFLGRAYVTTETPITYFSSTMMVTQSFKGNYNARKSGNDVYETPKPARLASDQSSQSFTENQDLREFETEPNATTEAATMRSILNASSEPRKWHSKEVKSANEVFITTEAAAVEGSDFEMPTQMYRGRTKYRDTVKNTLENEWTGGDGELKLTVAESVYYRPRVSPISTFTYKEESRGAIPGQPGRDYPIYSSPPRGTGFRCPRVAESEQKMLPDRGTRCQVFYICKGNAPPSPVLCPNGTVFNEDVLVCDWWYNVDC